MVSLKNNDEVSEIQHITQSDIWINGGYFVFKKDIFNYFENGEELVNEPFARLIEKRELISYKHDGFWASMDTFKDKQQLGELYQKGNAPWQVWNSRK